MTPDILLKQLIDGGKMIIPVGGKEEQLLTLYTKTQDSYKISEIEKLNFVPLIGKDGW